MQNRLVYPLKSNSLRTLFPSLWLVLALLSLTGCNRLRHVGHDTVYVSARQMYLHDRVAAVSNRVAAVNNGQKLVVLDHFRRFYKVQTEKKEIGWIEEHSIIDSKTFDAFQDLASKHKDDPVISTAVLRDDLYLHVQPGRETPHFMLVAGNARVQLLQRTSVQKTPAPGSMPIPPKPQTPAQGAGTPAAAQKLQNAAKPQSATAVTDAKKNEEQPLPPPPPVLEDWWMVRDGQGHVGWLLGSRMDVDVPDEIALYAEGQRIVSAYVLTKVFDSEAKTADHMVPEYVTLLSPPKSGLPFDFDQVRVFTWSLKKHRYETAFRLRPVQGYLPLKITQEQGPRGSTAPVINFQIANTAEPDPNASWGTPRPKNLRIIRYQLVDTQLKRVGPDLYPLPSSHKDDDKKQNAQKGKAGKTGKKKGR